MITLLRTQSPHLSLLLPPCSIQGQAHSGPGHRTAIASGRGPLDQGQVFRPQGDGPWQRASAKAGVEKPQPRTVLVYTLQGGLDHQGSEAAFWTGAPSRSDEASVGLENLNRTRCSAHKGSLVWWWFGLWDGATRDVTDRCGAKEKRKKEEIKYLHWVRPAKMSALGPAKGTRR